MAAVDAARDGIAVALVGATAELRSRIDARIEQLEAERRPSDPPLALPLPIEVVDAPDRITMDDSPARAVRNKPTASMPRAYDLVRSGDAQAVVSAGNSGAMLACGLFKFGRIRGLDRPAIVSSFPTQDGFCCMLDMGANVECRPLNLVQFAVLGAVYDQHAHGRARPRVGILSNGTELGKGTELTREADAVLRANESPDFEYIGYVEGKHVWRGDADVVVTDGFTGNVALKFSEGAAEAFARFLRRAIEDRGMAKIGAALMRKAFADVRSQIDPDTYGGAPLLGVKGVSIICHGGSSAKALANGIRVAAGFVEGGLTPGMADALTRNKGLFAAAR